MPTTRQYRRHELAFDDIVFDRQNMQAFFRTRLNVGARQRFRLCLRRCGSAPNRKPERTAAAELTRATDIASHRLDEIFADCEVETLFPTAPCRFTSS